MVSLTGQSIGRYHILEQLGEGGMATVYKAYDTRLERNVAFKVLRTDLFGQAVLAQVLQRFEREAKSLAKLKHPNIVNILDYGEHEGMPYLVMEYLPGGTLKQKLGQALFWGNAIQLLLPVARGLSYAHQHGVIHRDVKPANILIDQNEEPILTDFGIAKLLEGTDGHTLTGSGVGIGTPEYMAPEQGIGARAIDARADIYSLGIVFYEMVTGRKPYIADTPMAVVLKQMTDPLPHPAEFVSDLPESVEHILLKALTKDPNDRYPDMHALIAAMENALAETNEMPVPAMTTSNQPVEGKTKARAKPSPKMIVVVVGALVVIMLIIFGAPRIKQLFPAMPAAEATSTRTLTIRPTATVTVAPPGATPRPSPILTNTPDPTATNTPAPAWETDFAQPILDTIDGRTPNTQENFDLGIPNWVKLYHYGNDCFKVVNGEMIDGCLTYWTMWYTDYVVEMNIRFISASESNRWEFYFRNFGEGFFFNPDGSIWANIEGGGSYDKLSSWGSDYRKVLIIVHDQFAAVFVDDQPLLSIDLEPRWKNGTAYWGGAPVAFDYIKIWDLNNLKNSP